MGIRGIRRKRDFEDEPTLLGDVEAILEVARRKGFINDFVVDIEEIIKFHGIELNRDFSMEPSISGILKKDRDRDLWIITINGKHNIKRQRFTMAHEFAHFCLHKDERGLFVDEEIYFRKDHVSAIEFNADSFAAELLMPRNLFKNAVENKTKNIKDLADLFNVSVASIKYRAENLGFKTKSHER